MVQVAANLTEFGLPEARTPTRRRAKRWLVRETLRSLILDGQLAAGTRIVQQDLANQLGTSVSVVRELLIELTNMGLVEMEEDRGFAVVRLDLQRLKDTYLVRSMHEGLAARLCCQKASRQNFRQLRDMAAKILSLHERGGEEEHREAAALDREFHAELIRIADSEPLHRAWRTHWIPIAVSKIATDQRYDQSYDDHLAIVKAIEEDCPDEAERMARRHVEDGLRYLVERIEAGEAELPWLV